MPGSSAMEHPAVANTIIVGAAVGTNLVAFAQSADVGTIVAFCTVAIPAVCTAVAYALKNLGPAVIDFAKSVSDAWLDHRRKVAEIQATTLSGQLGELNRRLARSDELAGENARLAETRGEHVDELLERIGELTAKVTELTALVATGNDDVRAANLKLHALRKEAHRDRLRAESAEKDIRKMAEIVRHNGDLTVEAKDQILRLAEGLAEQVDRKADSVVKAVETLASDQARLSGDDLPAVPPTPG